MAKTAEQSNLLKPPLKWAGGKRWLVQSLQYYWRQHKHKRLVEPFCGGLSVALGLNPERALLNDLNLALINFYQHLK
jgi:DNA adenine methylase